MTIATFLRHHLSRIILALAFVAAGVLHFVRPQHYVGIMPPYLPYHLALVYVSGVFEILGGLGVLIPRLRRAAGIGLILLLIAVFPANVFMLQRDLAQQGWNAWTIALVVRLPLQVVLGWWVYRCALRRVAARLS